MGNKTVKAYITSIGEPTTDLCLWSLKRNGFDVVLVQGNTTLAEKLKQIYNMADDDFVRVDADVIPNRNLIHNLPLSEAWWYQFQCFDWYKQGIMNGGVQYITKKAIPILRSNIDKALNDERPETTMWRLPEFENPRRCVTKPTIMGLHGYANDLDKAKAVKTRRGQIDNYDFELAERLNEL